jgi:hypothetical protein
MPQLLLPGKLSCPGTELRLIFTVSYFRKREKVKMEKMKSLTSCGPVQFIFY